MIFSKASLAGVGIIQRDKQIPVLNNVLFCKDGVIVVGCRNIFVAIEPVPYAISSQLHLESTPLTEDVLLSGENVKRLFSMIPSDTKFKGYLEYFDMTFSKPIGKVVVNFFDGIQDHRVIFGKVDLNYFTVNKIFGDILQSIESGSYKEIDCRIRINLSRLSLVLSVIKNITGDKSGEIPVYLCICKGGQTTNLFFKTKNPATGQDIVAVSGLVGIQETEWVKKGKIERKFIKHKAKV